MYFSMVKKPLKLLKNPRLFKNFYITQSIKILKYKITKKKKQSGQICGRKIASMTEANNIIYNGLMGDKPFAIMRIGSCETNFVINKLLNDSGAADGYSSQVMKKGKESAGIFPLESSSFDCFVEEYKKSIEQSDVSVYWGHILCEEYVLEKYSPKSKLIPSRALEPFGFEKPWTTALKDKKVLVVHPFEKTIINQYKNREKIFNNPNILPEFKLKTYKAVQSLGDEDCGFSTWIDALTFMKKEIKEIDFDIAVLGCGAYAMPLAAFIKELGKKAIVLGGMTQLLFGIKGARWEASRPDIVELYNEYWVRADKHEKPMGSERTEQGEFEQGAYW